MLSAACVVDAATGAAPHTSRAPNSLFTKTGCARYNTPACSSLVCVCVAVVLLLCCRPLGSVHVLQDATAKTQTHAQTGEPVDESVQASCRYHTLTCCCTSTVWSVSCAGLCMLHSLCSPSMACVLTFSPCVGVVSCCGCSPKGSYCDGGVYSAGNPANEPAALPCGGNMTTLGLRSTSARSCGELLPQQKHPLPAAAGWLAMYIAATGFAAERTGRCNPSWQAGACGRPSQGCQAQPHLCLAPTYAADRVLTEWPGAHMCVPQSTCRGISTPSAPQASLGPAYARSTHTVSSSRVLV